MPGWMDWFDELLNGIDSPDGMGEDQILRKNDAAYVPQNGSSTAFPPVTADDNTSRLGIEQIINLNEAPEVPQVQVNVPNNYDSENNNNITYINEAGLVSDINGNAIMNDDGTYTDAEGHTIMSDEHGYAIMPQNAPGYYSWYRPSNQANQSGDTGTITVNGELVKTDNGQLLAVSYYPDSSLKEKLTEFAQGIQASTHSILDTLAETRKVDEGVKYLLLGGLLLGDNFTKFSKIMQSVPKATEEIGKAEEKITQGISKAATEGSSKAAEELGAAERAAARGPGERPSWRQSEKEVGNTNPEYEAQKSFKDGQEVSYGTKGSVRPDYYKPGSTIEVKNYDVSTSGGQNRLIDNITEQVMQRNVHLPDGTGQKIVIDVRGQNITNDVLRNIRDSIINRTGGNIEIEFLR